MRTIRLPAAFEHWGEYQDTYNVDVLLEVNVMRCRACGFQWAIAHNRGKLMRGAHVCSNGCNGKPRDRRGGQPPMLRAHLEELREWRGERDTDRYWEKQEVRDDSRDEEIREARQAEGRVRRTREQMWLHLRRHPDRWAALDRMWEEAGQQSDPVAYVADECSRLRKVEQASSSQTSSDT